MGPVIGAAAATHGVPVIAARTTDSSRNDSTYVADMCRRSTRQVMMVPSTQITAIGATTLPHWTLSTATVAGARNTTALTPKFVGFQRWRPRTRSTYFDAIEIRLVRKYGQRNGDLTRIPALMPLIYALAGCGQTR